MKTFFEWANDVHGYQLFLQLLSNPDDGNASIFIDWLTDADLPATAELLRAFITGKGHGYFQRMTAEMNKSGIDVPAGDYIAWNNKYYTIVANQVLVKSKGKKWQKAREEDVKEIFPGLAVVLMTPDNSGSYTEDHTLKDKFLYKQCSNNLGELVDVSIQVANDWGRIGGVQANTARKLLNALQNSYTLLTTIDLEDDLYTTYQGEVLRYANYALTSAEGSNLAQIVQRAAQQVIDLLQA